ncbi:TPA: MipA/OmpV family protein [Escherichia coli]|nr:MipA/OmpV family protein [Escherichia coli]
MKKYRFLAVCLMAAMSVTAVRAEGSFTLGAGVGVNQHPWRGYGADTRLIPAVSYDGDTFWFRGLGGGVYLWDDASDTLSIAAWWAPVYFKPGDSDNRRLRLLDERKSTMMAGVTWSHHTPLGFLRTSIAGDALGNSHGGVWDVAWLYRYVKGGLTLTPGVGMVWNSRKQNDYYYGVSRHESLRSGLPRYEPGSSVTPYLEMSVNYRFEGGWGVYGSARYRHLSDEETGSPMVDKKWDGILSTGITYHF